MALMASGFNGQHFVFLGYLPIDKHERIVKIKEIEKNIYQYNQTQIFIEAPYRNNQLIDCLLKTCRSETRLCIASEISLQSESIKTKSIELWRKTKIDFHKKTVIYLLYK